MNKRRLLKLADLLEADAKNKKGVKFDLGVWAAPADNYNHLFDTPTPEVMVSCQTSACAFGLACISGTFKHSGLSYLIERSIIGGGYQLVPTFNGKTELEAAQELFGIDTDASEFLFMPENYPDSKLTGAAGERYVAKRIRDFVAGKFSPSS